MENNENSMNKYNQTLKEKQRKMLNELRMVECMLALNVVVEEFKDLCWKLKNLAEKISSIMDEDDDDEEEIDEYSKCIICEEEFIGGYISEDICKKCIEKV